MATGILVFVLGLVLGSFLNAVLWRMRYGRSVFWERSRCVYCSHQLGFWDLFPVLSFLWLRGRCHYCQKKITWQYPMVELVSALGLVFIYSQSLGLPEKIWVAAIFLLWLLIFIYDLRHLIIPDIFIILGFIWILLGLVIIQPAAIKSGLLTGLGIFIFFFALHFFSKGSWLGGGDVKLGFLIGLWLGWPLGGLALLISYIVGAVIGLSLVVSKKAGFKSQIPFGPFLVWGSLAAYFYGYQIINWYTGLFF